MEVKSKRKKRSDRKHAIYQLTNLITNEVYVGMTVCSGLSPKKAVEGRWKRHVTRALTQGKDWALCKAIREHGPAAFKVEIIETIRGKAITHTRERELTKELQATLNTV